MPKLKTKKTLRKRVKKTATGELLHQKQGTSHLKRKASASRAHRLKKEKRVLGVDKKRFGNLIN